MLAVVPADVDALGPMWRAPSRSALDVRSVPAGIAAGTAFHRVIVRDRVRSPPKA